MLAAAGVILPTHAFPRWLGWLGALLGTAMIASPATLLENDPHGAFATLNGLAWVAYFLWIAALSISLIRATMTTKPAADATWAPTTPRVV